MKLRLPYVLVGAALICLVAAKILLTGIFFRAEIPTPGMAVAHAQDRRQAKATAPAKAAAQTAEGFEKVTPEALREKDLALKAREAELKKKEDELLPLKKDIEEKLGELNELQSRLTAYAKTLADREEALKETKLAHLVELYTAMEPTKAAAIMEKLKIETVVLILRNMKGKPAGQIIALLKPELGAQVVEKLSKRD
jgi:flagellar motility protein MotE (MotC chaperone)